MPYRKALETFRSGLKADYGLRMRDEIHASEFINKAMPHLGIPKYKRLEIIRKFAEAIASLSDIRMITVLVDKHGKAAGYDVFTRAWTTLIQRFNNTIEAKNFPGGTDTDFGMVLPDNTDDKKLKGLLRRMRAYNPVANQAWVGPGFRNLPLPRVIEDPCFRDSKHSYFTQAADTCAYLIKQALAPSGFFRKKGGKNYFKKLQPIACTHASGKNKFGVVRL